MVSGLGARATTRVPRSRPCYAVSHATLRSVSTIQCRVPSSGAPRMLLLPSILTNPLEISTSCLRNVLAAHDGSPCACAAEVQDRKDRLALSSSHAHAPGPGHGMARALLLNPCPVCLLCRASPSGSTPTAQFIAPKTCGRCIRSSPSPGHSKWCIHY